MENIGKYKIEKKIGSGGFGEVFKGYDPFIKRHVAVKTCSSKDEEIRNRFFQEAEIAGNLQHRNITTVYDFGIHDGLPYLIQEYLSGEDLDAKIKRRDFLPYPEKLYYLLQIARGLAQAHNKGVIHRDIKPANIRVLEDGTVKIMDFGIAKLAQQESGLTQTGMTLGTAAYLAPEQIRGEAVDHRTDIFSFGVLAYELLTHGRPFQGQQISAVIYQVLNHEPTPILELAPSTPVQLTAIVERCLRKNVAERLANGGALVKELEGLQKRDRPPPARKSPPRVPDTELPTETLQYSEPEDPTQRLDATSSSVPVKPHDRPPTAIIETTPQLEDISYSLGQDDDNHPGTVGPSFAAQATETSHWSTVVNYGLFLLLALTAAGAGWWFGMRGEPEAAVADEIPMIYLSATTDGSEPTEVDNSTETNSEATAGQEASGGTSSGSPSTDSPSTTGSESSDPSDSATTAAPATPAPESPPAKPANGRVLLPIVDWTQNMTVQLAGRTYELHGARIVDLPPGRYQATFELATGDYTPASRTVQVSVIAGKSQKLEVAIPPPGALSVRPLPSKAQGQALIDGELIGNTPLTKFKHEPGEYSIEIRPQSGEGEGLTEIVRLESGKEVILTFDLGAGAIRSRTKALSP